MKKLILIMLLSGFMVSGQMKVSESVKPETIGKIAPMGMLTAELTKKDGLCVLTYKDASYQQIQVFKSFSFRNSDIDTVYNILSDFSNVKEGDVKNVDLEDGGKLNIEYKKSMGQFYASTIHIDKAGTTSALPYLTKKQLSRLFGKVK